MNSKNQLTTIENITKRVRKVETKPFEVVYDRETSSYIIKTTQKVIYPKLLGSFIEGLKLWISTIIINDDGFLNVVLKEE